MIFIRLLMLLFACMLPKIAYADVQECVIDQDCYLIYVPSNKTDSNSPITDLSEATADFYYFWNNNGVVGTQLTETTPDNINVYQIGSTGNYKLLIPSTSNILTSGVQGKTFCVYVLGYSNITTNRVACVYVKSNTDENTVARMPTSGSLVTSGTGTGQISLSSGTVTVGAISTNAITTSAIADGAITPAKEYIVADTVNAISTTTTIYTSLAVLNARTYNNMCLYSASNGERSRILSTGNGYFKVRGFSVAPTNGSNLKIYSDGCL